MIAKGLYTHKIRDFIITVATEEEKKALVPEKYWKHVVITGIGFLDTILTLRDEIYDGIDEYRPSFVINIGYAGSKNIPVGTVCRVDKCTAYRTHDLDTGAMQLYQFDTGVPSYYCYSATDFIEKTTLDGAFLIDMELLAHSILKCTLASIKVVSDNMSIKDYFEKALKESYTEEIEKVLQDIGVEA